jgi:thiamine-phosphate pyrophosphorylase
MPSNLQCPLIYLITSGETTERTTPATEDYANILRTVQAAVAARIDLIQIREKTLSANVLYQLATSAAAITKASATKLLINDRSDIAAAAGADGVHLTTSSLPAAVVRQSFGERFLIGVSTHSAAEADQARQTGADFVVFGPVFDTESKKDGGEPVGLLGLAEVCSQFEAFPVLALGGVTIENVAECFRAGAFGVAAIRMLQQPERLADLTTEIRNRFEAVSGLSDGS